VSQFVHLEKLSWIFFKFIVCNLYQSFPSSTIPACCYMVITIILFNWCFNFYLNSSKLLLWSFLQFKDNFHEFCTMPIENKMKLKTLCLITLTHWLPEFFAKNAFFDILEILSLDMSQISSNLLKGIYNIIACLSFFPLTLRFATFLLSHAQKSNYAYLRLQWADHTVIWVSLERSFPPAECELYEANFG